MAYNVEQGAVLAATIRGRVNGQIVMTTFHYEMTGAGPIDGVVAINAFNNVFNSALNNMGHKYAQAMGTNWEGLGADYQWVYPLRYRKVTIALTHNVGLQPDDATTSNIAAAITTTGEVATRRGQATKHIPAVPNSGFSFGVFVNPYKGSLVALADQIKTAIAAGGKGWIPEIYGRARAAFEKCGVVYPALPVSRIPIDTTVVQDTVRVMRRRTVGLGI